MEVYMYFLVHSETILQHVGFKDSEGPVTKIDEAISKSYDEICAITKSHLWEG